MKLTFPHILGTGLIGLILTTASASAEQLSAENFDRLDQWGLFTPAFKTAVHDLVNTKQSVAIAKEQEKDLSSKVPDLQKQAAEAQKKVESLQKQLTEYDHTDEKDFSDLQKTATNAEAKPGEVIMVAQAYIWAYPTSSHQADAQQILQQMQKKITDQVQADKDAAVARADARAKLLVRVQAKDLSLDEWRDFLHDLSQEDVIKYLGRPQSIGTDSWTYTADWAKDPDSDKRIGLQIFFDATRVHSVGKVPRP